MKRLLLLITLLMPLSSFAFDLQLGIMQLNRLGSFEDIRLFLEPLKRGGWSPNKREECFLSTFPIVELEMALNNYDTTQFSKFKDKLSGLLNNAQTKMKAHCPRRFLKLSALDDFSDLKENAKRHNEEIIQRAGQEICLGFERISVVYKHLIESPRDLEAEDALKKTLYSGVLSLLAADSYSEKSFRQIIKTPACGLTDDPKSSYYRNITDGRFKTIKEWVESGKSPSSPLAKSMKNILKIFFVKDNATVPLDGPEIDQLLAKFLSIRSPELATVGMANFVPILKTRNYKVIGYRKMGTAQVLSISVKDNDVPYSSLTFVADSKHGHALYLSHLNPALTNSAMAKTVLLYQDSSGDALISVDDPKENNLSNRAQILFSFVANANIVPEKYSSQALVGSDLLTTIAVEFTKYRFGRREKISAGLAKALTRESKDTLEELKAQHIRVRPFNEVVTMKSVDFVNDTNDDIVVLVKYVGQITIIERIHSYWDFRITFRKEHNGVYKIVSLVPESGRLPF